MYSQRKLQFALVTAHGKLGASSFIPLDVNFEAPFMEMMSMLVETFKLKKDDYYLRRLQISSDGRFVAEDKLHMHLSPKAQAIKENGHVVIYPLSFHDDDQISSTSKDCEGWMTKSSIKETKKTANKRRWFVLSHDHLGLLYYYQTNVPNSKPKGIIDLEFFEVMGEHSEIRLRKKTSFAGDNVEYVLLPDNIKEAKDWMSHFRKLTTPGVKTVVFGCYLTSLDLRGLCQDGIPRIVIQLVEDLERRAMDVQGIFRVPGSANDIEQLQHLIDSGVTPQFQGYDVHTIAGLFKQYLRELPEPLFTYKRYNEFITHAKDAYAVINMMAQLPAINQVLIHYILVFLRKVVAHSQTNLMEERSLATVFAPNILRPREETHSTLCDSDLVTSLLLNLMRLSEHEWQPPVYQSLNPQSQPTNQQPVSQPPTYHAYQRSMSADYTANLPPPIVTPTYGTLPPSLVTPPPQQQNQRPQPIPKSPSMPMLSPSGRPQPMPVSTIRSPLPAPSNTFRGSFNEANENSDILIAKYDYTSQGQRNAKGESAMSMKKGDIIYIIEKREHWTLGEINGQIGLVPNNYTVPHSRNIEEELADVKARLSAALKKLHEYECSYYVNQQ